MPMNIEKMCRKKKVYWSAAEAKSMAQRCIEKRGKKGLKLRTYNCPFCLQWHLSSKPLRENHDEAGRS